MLRAMTDGGVVNLRARARSAVRGLGSAVRPTDTSEVEAILSDDGFDDQVRSAASSAGVAADEALTEAATALREMSARHSEWVGRAWARFGRWLPRGVETIVDEEALERLRRLDKQHSLIFLISHRSYLDEW